LLGGKVHLGFEVWIRELLVEDLARITKVDDVFLRLPRSYVPGRDGLVVADCEGLPRDMANLGGVDGVVEVFVVGEGRISRRIWPRCPILHKLINCTGGHLNAPIQKIGENKVLTPSIWREIVGWWTLLRWGRGIWREEIAIAVA
jgi:hypothetical protein